MEMFGYILVITGSIICLIGAIGVLKFPDFYTRMHAAGVIDSFGIIIVLAGVAILSGGIMAAKILLMAMFIFITSPTNTHSIAHSAYIYQNQNKESEEE